MEAMTDANSLVGGHDKMIDAETIFCHVPRCKPEGGSANRQHAKSERLSYVRPTMASKGAGVRDACSKRLYDITAQRAST